MVQEQTKKCPLCAEQIKAEAVVCKFCGRNIDKKFKKNFIIAIAITTTGWVLFSVGIFNIFQKGRGFIVALGLILGFILIIVGFVRVIVNTIKMWWRG